MKIGSRRLEWKPLRKRFFRGFVVTFYTLNTKEDKDFQQSAHIICTGKVLEVRKEEKIKSEEEGPNYLLDVQTYELELHLYTYFEGDIQKGNIISGGMWLFGNVRKKAH